MLVQNLTPYRRTIRPTLPASFPSYMEQELDRLAVVTSNIIQALTAIEARLAALETP